VWLLTLGTAFAVEPLDSTSATGRLIFDIAAQPLEGALERYGDITGWAVLYNADLARGQRSTAVRGLFTPDLALQVLLSGTGLAARHTSDTSIMLAVASALPAALATAASTVLGDYYGEIQGDIRKALCANAKSRPGSYRVAARFWIDATGGIQGYRRLGSSGDQDSDRAIDAVLRNLKFRDRPPLGFAQPITIAVVPQVPGVTTGCAR
jgi:hypothetical protein